MCEHRCFLCVDFCLSVVYIDLYNNIRMFSFSANHIKSALIHLNEEDQKVPVLHILFLRVKSSSVPEQMHVVLLTHYSAQLSAFSVTTQLLVCICFVRVVLLFAPCCPPRCHLCRLKMRSSQTFSGRDW